MAFAYISPSWFYGYDAILELIFAVISFVIAFFVLRIYRETDQRSARLLGIAFLFFSLAYVVESIVNFLIISKLNENICQVAKISSIIRFDSIGIYSHFALWLTGLVILTFMLLKPAKKWIFFLLLFATTLAIVLSKNVFLSYYLISSLYLGFISYRYIRNFLSNRQTKTLLVALAFLCLFFGSSHFLFAVNHELFYVVGHFLELIAYLLIMINFYLVLKK